MKVNYKRIYFLLSQIPESGGMSAKEKLESWVGAASNGRTCDVRSLDSVEYRTMLGEMNGTMHRLNAGASELETWRRRVIGATCKYFELMGYYKDLSPAERIEKAKGAAVKAKGDGKRFNSICVTDLQAIYNAKLRQNRILRNANKGFEEDLKS
jgi:hypothetical protein